MKYKSVFLIICLISLTIVCGRPQNTNNNERKCGYEGCPQTPVDKLNIHLVPHTHDDVGWLKTIDQYYYGSSSMIQKAGVQYILDSVVHELLRDPSRRFIYVESAFFFKWWAEQEPSLQEKVKELVQEGRLEFIGGAWSMNDEGTTHYQSLIDQFAWGLKKLNDTFGQCGRPRIGWQIDPFGHSREMASIFAGMGFDGLFFARLDWEDKKRRLVSKRGEMVWQSSPNLGQEADLFTGILSNHYSAPPGFCFDYLCNDEPIIDDDLGFGFENNVKQRLDKFYEYITNMTLLYSTNNLMVPMGDDFNYQDASMYYKNMDKIIKYSKGRKVNGKDINIFYSTPSCYLKSLHDSQSVWPTETEDFFPYSTDPHTYWSGYFTSRPTLKRFERVGNNFLQVCKKLSAIEHVSANMSLFENNLIPLREAMGIMQHHDAITGTEKSKVAHDYARILHKAIELCNINTNTVLKNIMNPDKKINIDLDFQTCFNLNASECDITESSNKFMVTLYNPLSHEVEEYVRIPVHEGQYLVKDPQGNVIKHQIVPIPKNVLNIPNRMSIALNELVFKAPVKSLKSFYIKKISENSQIPASIKNQLSFNTDNVKVVENSQVRLTFTNNVLTSIESNGANIALKQEFFYYDGAVGNNLVFENRSSGAYIFRPNGTEKSITIDKEIELNVIEGPLVKEIHQNFLNWNASQIIRIYDTESFVEFEWLIGPIPIADKIGKEVITRFTTDLKTNGIFYTDSNGREMIKRQFNDNTQEWRARNYYPVTAKIAIESATERLAILNDRAQGGGSLGDGQIELMIHRRLLHDDAFGVGEALNEEAYGKGVVARGKHYLYVGTDKNNLKIKERELQLRKHLSPWLFFSQINDLTFEKWQTELVHTFENDFNIDSLPKHINLMTLENWGNNQILIRYENIFEKTDGNTDTVTFSIRRLLDILKGTEIRETTLDGNQWLDETNRKKFLYENMTLDPDHIQMKPVHIIGFDDKKEDNFNIQLKPMQIRTFIVSK